MNLDEDVYELIEWDYALLYCGPGVLLFSCLWGAVEVLVRCWWGATEVLGSCWGEIFPPVHVVGVWGRWPGAHGRCRRIRRGRWRLPFWGGATISLRDGGQQRPYLRHAGVSPTLRGLPRILRLHAVSYQEITTVTHAVSYQPKEGYYSCTWCELRHEVG